MNRYRFKTREEFELIGRWNDEYECPVDWAEGGEMNEYLGQEIVNSDCVALCESNDEFDMDGWSFSNHDYVVMEEQETIDKNLLINCSSRTEANKVFDYLESLGESVNPSYFSYIDDGWNYVGVYKITNSWTIARQDDCNFGNKVISAKEFLNTSDVEEEDLLAKAKKLYPIGTKFYPAHVSLEHRRYCIVTNDKFSSSCNEIMALTDEGEMYNSSLKYGGTAYNRIVYHEGKWAEIVKEESLVGRWVKLLREIASDQPIGSYDLIIEDDEKRSCVNLEKYRMCARERITDGDLELMPEGWSPETINTIDPEYVECIKALPEFGKYGELGKIYKVEKWNHSYTDCLLVGTTSGCTAKNRFKPSTKEAYDAQNNPATSSISKIGDWKDGLNGILYNPPTNYMQSLDNILSTDANTGLAEYASAINPILLEDMIAYTKKYDKPLIENVQSISVNLRTKKKNNKLIF